MKDKEFINKAFNKAIKTYIEAKEKPNSLLYNSFLVVTIRILALIYGKTDILNPYYLDNSVVFFQNLGKYGVDSADLALFKEELLAFYEFDLENDKRKIKLQNPHFKNVLKYLIDMFVAKKKNGKVSFNDEEKFLELIYTTHTKNAYRISYAYLNLGDIMYLEKYYYSKLNEMDMTRELDLDKTIRTKLNLEALNIVGVNLTNLENMSSKDIEKAKNEAYNYFEVDPNSATSEDELNEKLNYYKMYGKKVTSGNGYVDILLLMSVIVTSFSVLAIIIFNII